MTKPVAITMGDPAGVGPELIEQLAKTRVDTPILIFGDTRLFAGLEQLSHVEMVDVPCAVLPQAGVMELRNAAAVIRSIELAVEAVKAELARALVTAPLNKAHLYEGAGFAYPGHTEFLAALDGAERSVMMLSGGGLRVVPVTIHIALNDVPKVLTPALLTETIDITARDLRRFLGREPRIAVAGLNPHAGENGHLGREEMEWIAPLIADLRAEFDVHGPYPADTLFHQTARQHYDVAICMYHDQALIPVKTLAFDEGVNVTLGLSFLRTSPDHGTAYDIAGKGIANPKSLFTAFDLANSWSA